METSHRAKGWSLGCKRNHKGGRTSYIPKSKRASITMSGNSYSTVCDKIERAYATVNRRPLASTIITQEILEESNSQKTGKRSQTSKAKTKSEQTVSELPPRKKRKTSHSKRVGIKADRMRHENSTMKDRQRRKRKLTDAVNPHTRETEATISCNASIDFNQNAANVDFPCNSKSLLPVTSTLCEPTFQSKSRSSLDFLRRAFSILTTSTPGLQKEKRLQQIAHSYAYSQARVTQLPLESVETNTNSANHVEHFDEPETDGAKRFEIRQLQRQLDKQQSDIDNSVRNR